MSEIKIKKKFIFKKKTQIIKKDSPSYDDLCFIIDKNQYIKNVISNPNKDKNSLSYLVTACKSQSDCIKFGNAVESIFRDLVIYLSTFNLKDCKPKNIQGKKERDHLFCDNDKKIIYYAELKSNINLDTEKSKSTSNKCLEIVEELKKEYKDYEIRWCLFACRHLLYEDIPSVIKRKYNNISDNVYGVNQFMSMMGINYVFSEENYIKFLNYMGDKMFKNIL
jgi:hypothetical protein